MSITCPVCEYDENPDDAEFCDACGNELSEVTSSPDASIESLAAVVDESLGEVDETIVLPDEVVEPMEMSVEAPSTPTPVPTFTSTARLVTKKNGSPTPEFLIEGMAIIGKFDPDIGPVDVDLEGFPDEQTVSRNHAEIYQEHGAWKIKDLGSINGVFIKRLGGTRFNARITTPEVLNSGDEVAIAKIVFIFKTP